MGGAATVPIDPPLRERTLETAYAQLGEMLFISTWAVGQALSPEQAVDDALAVTSSPPQSSLAYFAVNE